MAANNAHAVKVKKRKIFSPQKNILALEKEKFHLITEEESKSKIIRNLKQRRTCITWIGEQIESEHGPTDEDSQPDQRLRIPQPCTGGHSLI